MTLNEILTDIKSDRVKTVIFDSDTYNEMDDQYAIAYALGSERMNVVAINAALFHNQRSESFADGMEKSYEEIARVLKVCHREEVPSFRGCPTPISESKDFAAVDSPAVRNIIKVAHESEDMVYILTTGACTNVSSAIMIDPSIKENICVVWLGGNCLEEPELFEFNLVQDYRAGQYLINCGVNLILLPAIGAKGHGTQMLRATDEDLKHIKGDSDACVFFRDTLPDEFRAETVEYSGRFIRVIWDVAAPAVLSVPEALEFSIIPAPVFGDNGKYAYDAMRHKIIYMEKLNAREVFKDAFESIAKL